MRLPEFLIRRSPLRARSFVERSVRPEIQALERRLVLAATPVPITTIANPSFESVAATDGAVIGVAAWTLDGSFGNAFNPTASEYTDADDASGTAGALATPGDQKQVLFINDIATASQQLTTTVEANQSYALTVAIGDRADSEMQNYSVALFAGTTLVASTTGDGEAATDGGFTDVTITTPTFAPGDPLIGQPLRIELSNIGTKTTTAVQVNFDNVRLASTEFFPADLQEELDAFLADVAARKGNLSDAIEDLIANLEAQAQAQQAAASAAIAAGDPNGVNALANAQLLSSLATAIDGIKAKADAVIDDARERVNDVVADAEEMANEIVVYFRDDLPELLKLTKEEFKELGKDIKEDFKDIKQLIKESIRDIKKETIPEVKAAVKNWVNTTTDVVEDAAKTVVTTVTNAAQEVADTAKEAIRDVGNAASDAVNWAGKGIKKLFKRKR